MNGFDSSSSPRLPRGLTVPDLKAALEAHRPYGLDCKCGRPINSDADWAGHVDGVIAGLPGVAVTQLPEAQADPEYGDPYWPVELEGETYPGKLRIDYGYRSGPRIALIGIPTPLRVADVPNLTAALLSAAAAVVLSEGETR